MSTLAGGGDVPRRASAIAPVPDPSPLRKDYKKILSLASLHMGQYFPGTFTAVALPAIFRQQGLPLEAFWLLSVPRFPNWLKFLMALPVDQWGSARFGRRKSWIVPCTLIGAALYSVVGFIDPTVQAVAIIVTVLTIKAVVMAAQDIAVDALLAEGLQGHERATGAAINGLFAWLAILGGQSVVALVEWLGWQVTMNLAAAMLIVVAIPALVRPEPATPEARRRREERGERPDLVGAAFRKDSRRIMPFLVSFGFAGNFVLSLLGAFWIDRGLSLTQLALLSMCIALTGRGVGALLSPLVLDRLGLRVAAALGVAALVVEIFIYLRFARADLPAFWIIWLALGIPGIGTALYDYAVNASRYRWVSKAQAGTDFSVQSSFWNFGIWLGGTVSGFVAGSLGYEVFFVVGLSVAAAVALTYIVAFDRFEELVSAREKSEVMEPIG